MASNSTTGDRYSATKSAARLQWRTSIQVKKPGKALAQPFRGRKAEALGGGPSAAPQNGANCPAQLRSRPNGMFVVNHIAMRVLIPAISPDGVCEMLMGVRQIIVGVDEGIGVGARP